MTVVDARDRGLRGPVGRDEGTRRNEVLASDILLRRPHAAGEERDLVGPDLRAAERWIERLELAGAVHLDLLEDEEAVRRKVGEVSADLRLDRGCGLKQVCVRLGDRGDLRRGAEDLGCRDDDDHEDADRDQHLGEREGCGGAQGSESGLVGRGVHQSSSTVA